jgi:dolichyl-diphosphooligosaccharide--protein glycosyltransferase/undecaprenyl-diphosphooligosaccharide--protein glycosyltransferase
MFKSFTQNQKTLLFILLAFLFSFIVRLIWVYQFSDMEHFKFNNQFMINTNDGYYYAEGARDILSGVQEISSDLSPIDSAPSILTAFIAKILPISFESIILYMPVFLSSLIVIPIILIAREFGRVEVGFIAALIGSIAWSYYNRTMVGYYDTDMLNIVLPTILLWSLIWSLQTQKELYFLVAALDSILYRWWYPQSYSLEFSFISLIVIYILYQYIKKEDFKPNLTLVVFMLFALVHLDELIRLSMVILLYLFVKNRRDLIYRYIYYILGFALLLFLTTGGFDPIWGQLKGYVFRDEVLRVDGGLGLQFFGVIQTVREAGEIPFSLFANRISGHTITFILSIIGYIWLLVKHPIMLLSLPMVGLGFLAYGIPGVVSGGGLRFTIYAVPVMALGIAYLIVRLSDLATNVYIRYAFISCLTIGVLVPNIKHIVDYRIPTVFNKPEVDLLTRLKSIADRKDYVVTWWDYGYPIRYYSDVKTLIDGGKHGGAVNFPVSFILNSPQDIAAKMARLDVEYTERRFDIGRANKGLDENDTNYIKFASSNIEQMTLDYGYRDTNDFITHLSSDNIKLPKKSRDIYIYLPHRMLSIFPTVKLFSNIDLMSGLKKVRPFFYTSNFIEDRGDTINLGNGINILKKQGLVQVGDQRVSINSMILTWYNSKGELEKRVDSLNKSSNIYVIYMKNYNQFIVLDRELYDSLYIKLFVLEEYDKGIFESISMDPFVKVYRLKI